MAVTNTGEVLTVLGLAALWVTWWWVWPNAVVEWYRDSMFALRDELFDFMAAGNISPRDPAYVRLREQMNSSLRFAHYLTPVRAWWMSRLVQSRPGYKPRAELERAIESIADPAVRATMKSFEERMLVRTALLVIVRSLVLTIATVVVALAMLIFSRGSVPRTKVEVTRRADSRVHFDPAAWERETALTDCPTPA
jgi:hypothetical protein